MTQLEMGTGNRTNVRRGQRPPVFAPWLAIRAADAALRRGGVVFAL